MGELNLSVMLQGYLMGRRVASFNAGPCSRYRKYNDHILPDITNLVSYAVKDGTSVIYIKDGVYNFIYSGWNGSRTVRTNKACTVLWFQYNSTRWELQNGEWVKIGTVTADTDVPFDSVAWTNSYIDKYSSTSELFDSGRFMEASPDPAPVYI